MLTSLLGAKIKNRWVVPEVEVTVVAVAHTRKDGWVILAETREGTFVEIVPTDYERCSD